MATIRLRKGKWQVQVRRHGTPTISRTFILRADALRWAKQTEAEVDRHGVVDRSVLRRLTVADLFIRFRDEVCPARPGGDNETIVVNAFLRSKVARKTLANVKPADFSQYRDCRLEHVKPGTINRVTCLPFFGPL